MSQRILNAFGVTELVDDTIVETAGGVVDLLLPTGTPVSRDRAFERRREISSLYAELASADAVIITLGVFRPGMTRHPALTSTACRLGM
jgi:hypothetical protein